MSLFFKTHDHLKPALTVIAFLLITLGTTLGVRAQIYNTPAGQALLMDADTGTVLFAKESDTRIPPASLAKMMTMEVVFSQLKSGKLSLA